MDQVAGAVDTTALGEVAGAAGTLGAMAGAAEGVVKEGAAAVGEVNKEADNLLKKIGKCLEKVDKTKLLALAEPNKIKEIVKRLKSILTKDLPESVVSKDYIKNKVNLIINEFNNEAKIFKKPIKCLIGATKKISGISTSESLSAKASISASGPFGAKMSFKFGALSKLPSEIPIPEFNSFMEKEIDPMLDNTFVPMLQQGGELVRAADNAVEEKDISGLTTAIGKYMSSSAGIQNASKNVLSFDKDSSMDLDSGTDLSGNEPGSNPLSDFSESARKMHEQGTLKDYLNSIIESVGLYFGVFFLLLTMPAMPVIFYLSILYNVILLTWEKFKGLDTYQ